MRPVTAAERNPKAARAPQCANAACTAIFRSVHDIFFIVYPETDERDYGFMDAIEFWTICAANGILLDREQVRHFERFHDELVIWNKRINLISRQDLDNIYERHILHSLAILKYVDIPARARCMDLGTGGGFPGIPLKIALPQISMLLVDSIGKKIKTTGMLAQHTGMRGIEARQARAETLADDPQYRGAFDVITARAVAPLVQLVSWVEALLKPTGKIICLKGGDLTNEIDEATKKFPHLRVVEHRIVLPGAEWFEEQEKKVLVCTFTGKPSGTSGGGGGQ